MNYTTAIFDAASRSVTVAGSTTALQEKSWQVMELLREKAPNTVARAEIIDVVWHGNLYVGEKGLNQAIWAIRSALKDDSKRPKYIRTVPRLGYAWIAAEPDARPRNRARPVWLSGSLAAGLVALLTISTLNSQTTMFEAVDSAATNAYLVGRDIHVEFENGALGILKNANSAKIGEPVLSEDGAEIAITVSEADGCRMVTVNLTNGERQDFSTCPPGVS